MKTIKIGNVMFYKVIDNPSKPQEDTWLTHDGENMAYSDFME